MDSLNFFKKIKMVYLEILDGGNNILEIIEEYKKIYNKNSNILLKIIYNKIVCEDEFLNKIDKLIGEYNSVISFLYNLSQDDIIYEISTSDIGIYWKTCNDIKEYEMYGLEICCDFLKIEEILYQPISIICEAKYIGYHYNILKTYNNLTKNYKNNDNELVIYLNNDRLSSDKYEIFFKDNNIKCSVYTFNDTIGDNINKLIDKTKNSIVCLVNENDIYLSGLLENTCYLLKKNHLISSNQLIAYCPKNRGFLINDNIVNKFLLIFNKKKINKFKLLNTDEIYNIFITENEIKLLNLSQYHIHICNEDNSYNNINFKYLNISLNNIDTVNNLINEHTLYNIEITSQENKKKIDIELKKIKKYNIKSLTVKKLKILGIFDEFLYNNYKSIFDIRMCEINFEIKEHYDFFLCESCWNGNVGIWKGKINSKIINPSLKKILNQCEKLNIKTIFYNKEDPVSFNSFIETAKHFNIIITTDIGSVEKYKHYNKNIFVMPFTINPIELNNIGRENDNNKSFFAGSYTYSLSEIRKKNTEILCDKLKDKDNFIIFDRQYNYETIKNFYKNKFSLNIFPGKYNQYIHKSISYNEILKIHKLYNWCGNLNTVSDSETMFARRVIEASIMKNSIVTDYSKGVYNNFKDNIYTLDDSLKITNNYEILLNQIKKQKGWRTVIEKYNTYTHFSNILSQIGINGFENPFDICCKISMVCSSNRINNYKLILDNFNRQKYKNKELVIIYNIDKCDELEKIIDIGISENIIIKQVDEKISLGSCLNIGIELCSGEIISKIDDDDFYGSNYLTDMYYSMLISNADLVGKCACFIYSLENKQLWIKSFYINYENYTYQANKINFICGPTLFFKKHVWLKSKFRDINVSEDSCFINDAKENNFTIYASDIFNFCQIRTNLENHTWKCEWKKILGKKSIKINRYNIFPVDLIDI